MVKIETLLSEGKISRIPETELARYIGFFSNTYQDNLSHCQNNILLFPRWSIISGYYAMHDISKLFIARLFRFKIEKEVHATTIKMIRELLKDKEAVRLIEKGYEEFSNLADELNDAKKERVKVQYYTGSPYMKEKFTATAQEFYGSVVLSYIEKIRKLMENDH